MSFIVSLIMLTYFPFLDPIYAAITHAGICGGTLLTFNRLTVYQLDYLKESYLHIEEFLLGTLTGTLFSENNGLS